MDTVTITELAKLYDISTRTLRYYEELGILKPERATRQQRIYTKQDVARLRLILRGKKFGFSLEQIKEMITLFDQDRTGKTQLEKTVTFGKEKIKEVEERIKELEELKADMTFYLHTFKEELLRIKIERKKSNLFQLNHTGLEIKNLKNRG